jgi:streptomycin 6-kinase
LRSDTDRSGVTERIARLEHRFQLTNLRPALPGAPTHVFFGQTIGGDRIALKVSSGRNACAAEVEALRAFGDHRTVRVLGAWPEEHAILLERVEPGRALADVATEDEAIGVASRLLSRGWPDARSATAALPLATFGVSLERAIAGHDSGSCPVDVKLLRRALAMFRDLLDDESESVLLHGDLHYGNILSSDRAGHLLIDPKGYVGDAAFDVGYLVSRPSPPARDALPLSKAIDRRLAILPGATGLDSHRVAAFSFVAAALSAAWAIEDDQPVCVYDELLNILQDRTSPGR